MTHDPLCATAYSLQCDCGVIAVIRADEREQAARRIGKAANASADVSPFENQLAGFFRGYIESTVKALSAARGEA